MKNILIIEKNREELMLLTDHLSSHHTSLKIASSYYEAISLLEHSQGKFDIIVTESHLGDAGIIELSTYLKKKNHLLSLPIIFIYSPENFEQLLNIKRACQYTKMNFLQKPNLSFLKTMIFNITIPESSSSFYHLTHKEEQSSTRRR